MKSTTTAHRTRADYRKRQREMQVARLMRQFGLSREYARAVVALVYKRAG